MPNTPSVYELVNAAVKDMCLWPFHTGVHQISGIMRCAEPTCPGFDGEVSA